MPEQGHVTGRLARTDRVVYGSRFLNYYTNGQIKNALTELGLQLYPWKEQSVQQLF